MEIEQFRNLGLTKNESKIYLALLKLGKIPVIRIIQETGFHRNIIYDNLKKLLEKGLISSLKKDRKTYFEATSPENILDMFGEEQKTLDNKKKLAESIIKEITKIRSLKKEREEFTLYEGYKGVISVLELILKEKKEILTTGASVDLVEGINNYHKYFFPKWHKQRIKSRIPFKILFGEEMKKRGRELSKMKFTWAKFLSKEFINPISLVTVGDSISVIITWGKTPTALWINSSDVNKGVRSYFNNLWKMAKK